MQVHEESFKKLGEMKLISTSLANLIEKDRTLCLESIAFIFHGNSYCWGKQWEIAQGVGALSLQERWEHHGPRDKLVSRLGAVFLSPHLLFIP